MWYFYKASFDRSYKKLSLEIQLKVDHALNSLIDLFDERMPLSHGFGFKSISKYKEIRADIKTRVLLKIEKDSITFYFVGNHDEVQKFIKK